MYGCGGGEPGELKINGSENTVELLYTILYRNTLIVFQLEKISEGNLQWMDTTFAFTFASTSSSFFLNFGSLKVPVRCRSSMSNPDPKTFISNRLKIRKIQSGLEIKDNKKIFKIYNTTGSK